MYLNDDALGALTPAWRKALAAKKTNGASRVPVAPKKPATILPALKMPPVTAEVLSKGTAGHLITRRPGWVDYGIVGGQVKPSTAPRVLNPQVVAAVVNRAEDARQLYTSRVTRTKPAPVTVSKPGGFAQRVTAWLKPVGAKVPPALASKPLLPVVDKPLAYEPKPATLPSVVGPIPLPAPAASIPTEDYDDDGSEITVEERAAFITDAEPRAEPYSSGYVVEEESFEPDVPEMVEPEDLQPTRKKTLSLPAIGGIFLLLNLL